jgi:ribose transport system permease protein
VRLNAGARLYALSIRLLEAYSFSFALVLTVGLLVVTLFSESGGFGLTDQLANLAPIALAGMASTPAIISGGGGFDVSISPLMTLASAIFVVVLVPHGLGGAESIPIVLGMCAAVGALNGLIIVALRIQPVVATLSMYFALLGLNLQIAPQPETLGDSWISHLAHSVGPIPGAVFTIGLPLLIWGFLGLVPYRRTLLAVGNNDAAAFASGANVAFVRVSAYALGGLIAGIGGFALTALVSSVTASLASAYTLLAIASVALGGTSLWGGRGGLFGAVLGAAAIYLLQDLLAIAQVDPSWLQVMYGGMLLVAVVLSGVGARTQEA